MKYLSIQNIINDPGINKNIEINGWVRTKRGSKNVSFISINDGSTIKNLQIVAEASKFKEDDLKKINTGACIKVIGEIKKSEGKEQSIEIVANKILLLGKADPEEYPLQPKKHSLEFLREKAHLRFRTNTFSAVFRIRHALTFAIHNYFNSKGYLNIHTPIITGADAEGAGEMFQVTNLDLNKIPKNEMNKIDFSKDFFGKQTNLTVSGQLEAELGALALGKVYTFGPTFRAENSNTSRHLSEFWMIEPETAFADLDDNMDLAEDFLKYCINYCAKNYKDDIEFLNQRLQNEEKNLKKEERSELSLIDRLDFVINNKF